MANVKVVIHNKAAVVTKCSNLFYHKALPILCHTIMDDCNVYARKQLGTLILSARPENGGRLIRWQAPYAHIVYYTGTPRRNRNPNASLRWCEVAKRKHSKKWAARATELVNGG